MIFYGFTDRLPVDEPEYSAREYFSILHEYDKYDLEPLDFWESDADTLQGIMSGALMPDPVSL